MNKDILDSVQQVGRMVARPQYFKGSTQGTRRLLLLTLLRHWQDRYGRMSLELRHRAVARCAPSRGASGI